MGRRIVEWINKMKMTNLFSRSALIVCVVGLATAYGQEPVGVARLGGPKVQPTSYKQDKAGCTDCAEGCTDGSCTTGNGCANGNCAAIGNACANGNCGPGGRMLGGRLANRMMSGNCENGMCDPAAGGYGQGYQRRVNRLMHRQNVRQDMANAMRGGNFWNRTSASYQARNARVSQHLFGWLVPSGSSGQGAPLFGKYHTAYAQNPYHVDPRDNGMYAAQGYGTNITVPLAPNVKHAYNYGWGLPSSRITNVSNVAPYTMIRPLHW